MDNRSNILKLVENISDPAILVSKEMEIYGFNPGAKNEFLLNGNVKSFEDISIFSEHLIAIEEIKSGLVSGKESSKDFEFESSAGITKKYNVSLNPFTLDDEIQTLITFRELKQIPRKGDSNRFTIFVDEIEKLISDKEVLSVIEKIKTSYPFTFITKQKIQKEINSFSHQFWVKNKQSKYLLVNKAFAAQFGLKVGQIENKFEKDLIPGYQSKFLVNIDSYIWDTANSVIFDTLSTEYELPNSDLEFVQFPLCDLDGNVVVIIGFSRAKDSVKSEIGKHASDFFENSAKQFPMPFISLNKDEKVEYFSSDVCELLSIEESDFKGRTLREIMNKETYDFFLDFKKSDQISTEKLIEFDLENEKVYNLIIRKIFKQNDEIDGFNFSYIEKQKNFQLEGSDAMYDIIMQTSPQPIFIYNIENLKFLEVNDAALRLYGYTRDEFLGMDLTDLYAPEDIQTLIDSTSKKTVSSEFTGPWRHKTKSGKSVMVEISKVIIDFRGHRCFLNTLRDATNRLEEDKELRGLRASFENSSDLILNTDADGFITKYNDNVLGILEYTREDLNNKPFLSMVVDSDRAKINSKIFHSGLLDTTFVRTEIKKSSSEPLSVELIATPILDFKDNIESFVVLLKPEKTTETIIQKTQTHAPVSAEPKQGLDPQFLSNLFHEILTPINVIIGFVQELTESIQNPTEEQKEAAGIIKENQQMLLQIMDTASEYTQFEQSNVELNPTNITFVDLMDEIEKGTKKEAANEKKELSYGKISSSLQFESDKSRIISLVTLLVKFGLRITKQSSIYLSAYQIDSNSCAITIRDERDSISEHLVSAMNLVYTGEESLVKQKYGISRFTIRLARKLTEYLADRYQVLQRGNTATEFALIIPMQLKEKPKSAKPTEAAPKVTKPVQETARILPQTPSFEEIARTAITSVPDVIPEPELINASYDMNTPAEPQKMQPAPVAQQVPQVQSAGVKKQLSEMACLYLEDQVDSQLLFKVQMKELKSMDFAVSFEKALPLIQSKKFDFIVMDINLQGEYNGLDALRAIQKMPEYINVPIIAVTAYVLPGDRDKFIAAGFKEFISKPILKDKLEFILKGIF